MAQRFIEREHLVKALGGSKVLVQLLDKNKDGIPDDPLVESILDDASGEMASMIEQRVQLASLHAPYPRALVLKTSHIAAWLAWGQGDENQAMPDWTQKAYDAAVRWAGLVANGEASVGSVIRPQLDPPAKTVDADPFGRGTSIAGFKRGGFR